MTRVIRAGRVTFAALSVPNYRRYYGGQAISLIGTWMQMTAQAWLVLSLTHSSTTLGLIVALQTLPVLLLGPYGGVVADRVDKRRLIDRAPDRDGRPGADPGRAHGHRGGAGLGDRLAGRAARPEQRVREPGAPVVHARDGRPRAPAQRGQPQLGPGQHRSRDRPRGRGDLDRHRRRGRLLPGQRGELRGRRRIAGHAGSLGAQPDRADPSGSRPAPRGSPLRPRHA